jgi:hypothetical protein
MAILEEYAGVKSFQGCFRSVQPPNTDRLCRCDATEVAALGANPAASGIPAFEGLSNSLLQTKQFRQPLARQLLRMDCTCSPTLERAAVTVQRLGQILFWDPQPFLQCVERLARSHFKDSCGSVHRL